MPISQALEGGGPASELLAAFRARRMGALGNQGLMANGADAGHVSAQGQQSLAEGAGFGTIPIRNGTGTASYAVPDTTGWDGNGPGRAAPMAIAASLPPGEAPAPVTAAQLRAIMPKAGTAADRYVGMLNQAMAAHGTTTPAQRAALLAQVSTESEQLQRLVENLDYFTTRRLHEVWPKLFPTETAAAPYVHNPEALANRAYAIVNGNGGEASGDGFRFRGRGFIQVTGRRNYRRLGFENNPEALADPQIAADTATAFWQNNGLNGRTTGVLDRAQFDAVSRIVNGGVTNAQERWDAYQRALRAFDVGQ